MMTPPSVELKLLDHITWIKNNLHLLKDENISDEDWKKRREPGGAVGQPGCIWISKGGHPGRKKSEADSVHSSTIMTSKFVTRRGDEQGNTSSREGSSNSSSASKVSGASSNII